MESLYPRRVSLVSQFDLDILWARIFFRAGRISVALESEHCDFWRVVPRWRSGKSDFLIGRSPEGRGRGKGFQGSESHLDSEIQDSPRFPIRKENKHRTNNKYTRGVLDSFLKLVPIKSNNCFGLPISGKINTSVFLEKIGQSKVGSLNLESLHKHYRPIC